MDNQQIASTILKHLGGNRFCAMTGAKDFLRLERGLQFMIPRTRNIRKVRVTLTPGDDYMVEFYSLRGCEGKLVSANMATDTNLQQVFTSVTGLETHL